MKLGVLGSLVWDRIEHPASPVVERWGGVAYSLAAAAAAAPDGWTIRPLVRVGHDLAEEAERFLGTIPGLERPGGVVEAAEPNNRVRLQYLDPHRRHECLTGGVGPWEWDELAPHLDGLDALFVNLISGFELRLETAERLRRSFDRLLYADLHSLLLGIGEGGHRQPRDLPDRDRWLASFDMVQVNEEELSCVAGSDDPWSVADAAVAGPLDALLVTHGPAGATVVTSEGRCRVPVEVARAAGDPTGCGDVWGATCFVALLRGEPLERAAAVANSAAAQNLAHQGADGLYHHMRGEA